MASASGSCSMLRGASIGRFRLPTGWHVDYGTGTKPWVRERDALDIPYVVRYEIVR